MPIRRFVAVFFLLICQAFAQDNIFITPPQFLAAVGPVAVSAGDFNGDGKPDLAVLNGCPAAGCAGASHGVVSILLGAGDGTFQTHVDYPVGNTPSSLAVGDVNGDGKPDLVVTNQGSDTVSVLFGNGDGTFQSHVDYQTGGSPISVAVADFNGDGKPDLAVVSFSGSTVGIFLNAGGGTFPSRQDFATGYTPTAVTTGDFNKDGSIDLAVATDCGALASCNANSAGTVSILLGTGSGTFPTHTDYPVGIQPVWVTAADLSGSGNLDLAVANLGGTPGGVAIGGNVTILFGNGTGSFAGQNFASGNQPNWIGTGDFNGDGKLDFAVMNQSDETVSIFLNQGQNNFTPPAVFYGTGASVASAAIADFNGDQKLDLAIACADRNGTDGVCLLLGNSSGSFSEAPLSYDTGNFPTSAAVADLNADNKNDVVVTNFNDNDVSVFLGSGSGDLQPGTNYSTGTGPASVVIGDVNGDSHPDLSVANQTANTVSVLLNNGSGTFQSHVDYATASGPTSVVLGDVNGDGKPDLAVACKGGNSVSVLLGNGDGTFQSHSDFAVGVQPEGLAIGDFNGDGKPDLAAINTGSSSVTLLLNNGSGTFSSFAPIALQSGTYSGIAAADVNGDGKLDLAVAGTNSMVVLLGNGDGTFQAPAYYSGRGGSSIAIADFNGDGFPDIATGSPDGAAVFLGNGDGTFQPAVQYITGYSFFSGTVAEGRLSGSTASDLVVLNGGANGGSHTVTVLLSSVNSGFFLEASPGTQTVTAGNAVSFAVTVKTESGFNNPVSLDCTGLPSGATCAVAPSSVTPTAAGANATVTVATTTSLSAGSYPLVVTGTSGIVQASATPSLLVYAASSPSFNIAANPNSQSITAGNSVNFTITGTAINGFSGSVSLSCSGLPSGSTCQLNPGSITPTAGGASSTMTVTTVASAPAATYNLVVTGTSGSEESSAVPSLTVNAIEPDFSLSSPSSATPASIMPGQSATAVLTVGSSEGFSGTVSLTCSVAPQLTSGPTCSFSPQQVQATGGSSPTSTLTISTVAASAALRGPGARNTFAALVAFLPLLGMAWVAFGDRARDRKRKIFLVFVTYCVVVGAVFQVSCGGSKSSSSMSSGTPAGAYTVTITGSSTTQHTTSLTVSVQ